MAIAQRLKDLWAQGCDVPHRLHRDGYRHPPVPRPADRSGACPEHLVQDFDGDGEFDNYFHLKALTINGVYAGNPAATSCSTARPTGRAMRPSATEFRDLTRRSPTMKYQRFIDYWYENFARARRADATVARRIASGEIDPYADVDMD